MNERASISASREFLESATADLGDYAVGFVTLTGGRTATDGRLAGSGTLVVIDGTCAILTADHVLRHLPSTGEVGLILPTRFKAQVHAFTFQIEFAEKLSVATGPVEADGPDLGLLVLPSPVIGTIRASKSFYNLSRRQQEVLSRSSPTDLGIWCLCGIVHEWTSDAAPERGYDRVKVFRGMYGAGRVIGEHTRDQFDYIDFGGKYDREYEGPRSFEGCSGGAVWQIILGKSEAGKSVVKDRVLSGVAFYQSAVDDGTLIRCHGRRSIYDLAVAKIRSKAQ